VLIRKPLEDEYAKKRCLGTPHIQLSRTYRQRESRALLSLNEGFSVVAPMSETTPDSTYGRNTSCPSCLSTLSRHKLALTCWPLLNRCISSMNKHVLRPVNRRVFFASSKMPLTSLIPELVALSSLNMMSILVAMSRASVVLPHLTHNKLSAGYRISR